MADKELSIDDLKDITGGTEIVKIQGLKGVVPSCPGCGNKSAKDMVLITGKDTASYVKCKKCGGKIKLTNSLFLAGDIGGAAGDFNEGLNLRSI